MADGIRLLDPLAGLNQPDSAPRGHHGAMGRRSSNGAFCGYAAMAVEAGRRAAGRARRTVGRAGRPVALSMRARPEERRHVQDLPRFDVIGRLFVYECACANDRLAQHVCELCALCLSMDSRRLSSRMYILSDKKRALQ